MSEIPARLFSGILSNLVIGEAMTTAMLTEGSQTMPVQIGPGVMPKLGILREGPVRLWAGMAGDTVVVHGQADQYLVSGEILDVNDHPCPTTGQSCLKGQIRMADGSTRDFLVRDPEMKSVVAESYEPYGVNSGDFIAIVQDGVCEIVDIPDGETVETLTKDRARRDARNARDRARRAAKKAA